MTAVAQRTCRQGDFITRQKFLIYEVDQKMLETPEADLSPGEE